MGISVKPSFGRGILGSNFVPSDAIRADGDLHYWAGKRSRQRGNSWKNYLTLFQSSIRCVDLHRMGLNLSDLHSVWAP